MKQAQELNVDELIAKVPYQSIYEAVVKYLNEYVSTHRRFTIIFIVYIVVCLILTTLVPTTTELVGILVFIPIFILGLNIWANGEVYFFKMLAESWGWEFTQKLSKEELGGATERTGTNLSISHALISRQYRHAVVLASLGQSAPTFKKDSKKAIQAGGSVLKVDLPFEVPNVFLVSANPTTLMWLKAFLPPNFSQLNLPPLEGMDYRLYVERKLEIEAMQVFSDEVVLQSLLNFKGMIVEFSGTDVYVYYRSIRNNKELKDILTAAKFVLEELAPRLESVASSTKEMHYVLQEKSA